MRNLKRNFFLVLSVFGFGFISVQANTFETIGENLTLIGSTPGDAIIKKQLGIAAETKIDFIRWELKLEAPNKFALNIKFGENQPNTLGFVAGGQSKNFRGSYTVSKGQAIVYHLKTNSLTLSIIQLNLNLYHILSPENKLLVGNGGWSYSLNNANIQKTEKALPALWGRYTTANDRLTEVIFDGRTPCQDFAAEHHMAVSDACFKLKWKLTLYRDSQSYQPTTYSYRKVVDSKAQDIRGIWTIKKGSPVNPDVVMYQLNPDKPSQTISLLVGDENVLFFLHQNQELFVGNADFSFTLNKRATPINH